MDRVTEEEFFVKTSDWIKRKKSSTYAIVEDKKAVGLISLVEDNDKEASIGIWIASPYWRKGIGTKSMREIFETAKSLGYIICGGRIQKDNIGSIKMCKKLGGIFKDYDDMKLKVSFFINNENKNTENESKMTDDEKIDVAAKHVLEKYKPAFKELAK